MSSLIPSTPVAYISPPPPTPRHLIDPKISTLTPNGHLDVSALPRGLIPGERVTFALGSRKSSVISLGRASLEHKAVVSGFHLL